MGCRIALTLACVGLLLPARLTLAQAPEPVSPDAASAETTLSARSTLVVVPALVRNKAGELVFSLKVEDFVLTDDGVPQKLHLEQDTGGEPLALVVDIEGGGSAARQLDRFRPLVPMLESVIGAVPHKVAVVGFDSAPVVVQEFTDDTEAAARAVIELLTNDSGDGKAAILDSIGFSVELLRKQPPEYRRAILLVSETLDRGSQSKLDDALRAISDTNTAIYSIAFSSGRSEVGHEAVKLAGDSNPGPAGGCMARNHAGDPETSNNVAMQAYDCLSLLAPPLRLAKIAYLAARDGLQKNVPETIARLTGGEYFTLGSAKNLERDLQTISNHIPNRYVLSFQPQSPHPGFHVLSLQVPNYANLKVSARDGYWADTSADEIGPAPPPAH